MTVSPDQLQPPEEARDQRVPSLTDEVLRTVGEAAEALAVPDSSDVADDPAGDVTAVRAGLARVRHGAATVVVVGEKKRGKSSLVNALLGRRDLLPVDADVATSVHLTVRYGEESGAWVAMDGAPQPTRIELDTVGDYAAVDPELDRPRREGARHVEIVLPDPLLHGMTLVDTPGVGGLVSGHAQITLATLEHADALVFVVNGASELTASELRFLEQATERVAAVLFVLTQIDKYPSWQRTLERNQVLINRNAPRYSAAPWFAVSSRAKLDADRAAGGDDAASLLDQSGFPALAEALTTRVAMRAGALRLGNAVHVTRGIVRRRVETQHRRLQSLRQDPAAEQAVAQRQAALRDLQQQGAVWQKTVHGRSRALEQELRRRFQRHVNDLRALADEKIAQGGPSITSELPHDLEAGVRGIWMDLENTLARGLAAITADVGRQFGEDGLDTVAAELQLPERLQQLPAMVRSDWNRGGGLIDHVERFTPAFSAGGLTAMALSALTGGVAIPLLAGAGILSAIMLRRKYRDDLSRARGDAKAYVNRLVGELQAEIPAAVQDAVSTATTQLAEAVGARLTRERAALEAELAEHRRLLRTAEEELTEQRAAVTARLALLTDLEQRLADAATRLEGAST